MRGRSRLNRMSPGGSAFPERDLVLVALVILGQVHLQRLTLHAMVGRVWLNDVQKQDRREEVQRWTIGTANASRMKQCASGFNLARQAILHFPGQSRIRDEVAISLPRGTR